MSKTPFEIERDDLTQLLKENGVNSKRIKILKPVIENTAWMKVKLDEAREKIKNSQIVIAYDNGGGQRGLRENPLFKGYEALWKSYMSGMSKLLDSLPAETAAPAQENLRNENKTVLELVRTKCKEA